MSCRGAGAGKPQHPRGRTSPRHGPARCSCTPSRSRAPDLFTQRQRNATQKRISRENEISEISDCRICGDRARREAERLRGVARVPHVQIPLGVWDLEALQEGVHEPEPSCTKHRRRGSLSCGRWQSFGSWQGSRHQHGFVPGLDHCLGSTLKVEPRAWASSWFASWHKQAGCPGAMRHIWICLISVHVLRLVWIHVATHRRLVNDKNCPAVALAPTPGLPVSWVHSELPLCQRYDCFTIGPIRIKLSKQPSCAGRITHEEYASTVIQLCGCHKWVKHQAP